MRRADVVGGVAAVAPAPPLALALPLLLPPLTLLSLQLQKQQQKQQQNSSKSSGKSNSERSSKNSSDRDPLFETRGEATRTAAAGVAASVFSRLCFKAENRYVTAAGKMLLDIAGNVQSLGQQTVGNKQICL